MNKLFGEVRSMKDLGPLPRWLVLDFLTMRFIKKQEEIIKNLQKHILQKGKGVVQTSQEATQLQIENQKLKQEVEILQNKLKNTTEPIYMDYDSFKARVIDIPWRQTLKPVLEKIEGLDDIISEKICTGFPKILYKL